MEKICSPADISLLRERDTMEFFKNVQSWSLGGNDRKKMDNLFSLINEQIGFELFEEIERTKRMLSQKLAELFLFQKIDIEVKENITLPEFNSYTADSVHKILACLDQTIKDAQISYNEINLVCSTGGTAKVVAIQKGLVERFGAEKIQQHKHFHSIVHGLVKMAANLT